MKKKFRKLGRKYLKTWVGIFQLGFTRRGGLTGGNLLGGGFPDTEENMCEEFSSLHALTPTFIKKIFILQTRKLCVYSRTSIFFPMVFKCFIIL